MKTFLYSSDDKEMMFKDKDFETAKKSVTKALKNYTYDLKALNKNPKKYLKELSKTELDNIKNSYKSLTEKKQPMNRIRKFEELDYLGKLRKEKELENEFSKISEEDLKKRRKEVEGKELPKLKREVKQRKSLDNREKERREIVQVVTDAIISSELEKPGFEEFLMDLKLLLMEYPLENLPNTGNYSIFKK